MTHSHEMIEYPGVDENKERNLGNREIASIREQMEREGRQTANRSDYRRFCDKLDAFNRKRLLWMTPEVNKVEEVEEDEIEKSKGLLTLNPEQVGRVLGLHDYSELDQLDKSGSLPLKGGAKLYFHEDGTYVVAGYSADYSDVRKSKHGSKRGCRTLFYKNEQTRYFIRNNLRSSHSDLVERWYVIKYFHE